MTAFFLFLVFFLLFPLNPDTDLTLVLRHTQTLCSAILLQIPSTGFLTQTVPPEGLAQCSSHHAVAPQPYSSCTQGWLSHFCCLHYTELGFVGFSSVFSLLQLQTFASFERLNQQSYQSVLEPMEMIQELIHWQVRVWKVSSSSVQL